MSSSYHARLNIGVSSTLWELEKSVRFQNITHSAFANHLLRLHQKHCTLCRPILKAARRRPCPLSKATIIHDKRVPTEEIHLSSDGEEQSTHQQSDVQPQDTCTLATQVLEELLKKQTDASLTLTTSISKISADDEVDPADVLGGCELEGDYLEDQFQEKYEQLKEVSDMVYQPAKIISKSFLAEDIIDEVAMQLCENDERPEIEIMDQNEEEVEFALLKNECPRMRTHQEAQEEADRLKLLSRKRYNRRQPLSTKINKPTPVSPEVVLKEHPVVVLNRLSEETLDTYTNISENESVFETTEPSKSQSVSMQTKPIVSQEISLAMEVDQVPDTFNIDTEDLALPNLPKQDLAKQNFPTQKTIPNILSRKSRFPSNVAPAPTLVNPTKDLPKPNILEILPGMAENQEKLVPAMAKNQETAVHTTEKHPVKAKANIKDSLIKSVINTPDGPVEIYFDMNGAVVDKKTIEEMEKEESVSLNIMQNEHTENERSLQNVTKTAMLQRIQVTSFLTPPRANSPAPAASALNPVGMVRLPSPVRRLPANNVEKPQQLVAKIPTQNTVAYRKVPPAVRIQTTTQNPVTSFQGVPFVTQKLPQAVHVQTTKQNPVTSFQGVPLVTQKLPQAVRVQTTQNPVTSFQGVPFVTQKLPQAVRVQTTMQNPVTSFQGVPFVTQKLPQAVRVQTTMQNPVTSFQGVPLVTQKLPTAVRVQTNTQNPVTSFQGVPLVTQISMNPAPQRYYSIDSVAKAVTKLCQPQDLITSTMMKASIRPPAAQVAPEPNIQTNVSSTSTTVPYSTIANLNTPSVISTSVAQNPNTFLVPSNNASISSPSFAPQSGHELQNDNVVLLIPATFQNQFLNPTMGSDLNSFVVPQASVPQTNITSSSMANDPDYLS